MIFCLCFLLFLVAVDSQIKYYDRRYDYFDVDTLIENPRLLNKYMECFLDKGPCTPIGRVFKLALPEVVRSSCARCTAPQKRFINKAFSAFKQHLPESHALLKEKLDPQNKYYDAFEKNIAAA